MKAVIYARYSSDNQREESIEGQLRDCNEYAEYNDIEIVGQLRLPPIRTKTTTCSQLISIAASAAH